MFTSFGGEVRLAQPRSPVLGQGGLPGWNPSGSPAYMYQAAVQPAAGAPGPQPVSPPAATQPVVVPTGVPVTPVVTPGTTVVVKEPALTGLVIWGLASLVFLGAILIPESRR